MHTLSARFASFPFEQLDRLLSAAVLDHRSKPEAVLFVFGKCLKSLDAYLEFYSKMKIHQLSSGIVLKPKSSLMEKSSFQSDREASL